MITPNIAEFSRTADFFIKNGCYIKAPKLSKDWRDFWNEETRRCTEGYQVGDYKITGEHYDFLNFSPMKITVGEGRGAKKTQLFPKFNLLDYNWYWAKQIARWGIDEEKFDKLELYWRPNKEDALKGGKHLVCTKTRGCGFSYKAAHHGTYNYNHVRNSKSFYFASKEPYLLGVDGVLLKCWDNLEWLNGKTDGWWRKNRQEIDTQWTKKASVKLKTPTGFEVKGYQSMIGGIIVDNPDKVRGNRGELLIFEEAGSFKNLKRAIEVAKPLVEDELVVTGQIIVFGTGGNEDQEGIQGLEDIFYSPEMHNFMRFENIWDENDLGEFGFFVPCTAYNSTKLTDQFGNPLWDESKKEWEEARAKKKNSKDFKDYDRLIAERPFVPSESFKRVNSNIFADAMYYVSEQIRNIENNKLVKNNIKHGTIFKEGDKYNFLERTDAKPINHYPHKNNENLEGCFTIYEDPEKDQSGKIPFIYNVVVDPFAIDNADDKTSLGCAYVIKQNSVEYGSGDKIVASYIGRPVFVQKFYNNVLCLAEFYNATIQSEIAGGGQGLLDFLKTKNKLHYAEFEPDHILHGKELDRNVKNRRYFMRMAEDTKKTGLLYFAEWLLKERFIAEDNRQILNVHLIYDLGLLQEIAKFSNDPKKNFDRVSTMILAMYMFKEKQAIINNLKTKKKSDFFNRTFFADNYKSNVMEISSDGYIKF